MGEAVRIEKALQYDVVGVTRMPTHVKGCFMRRAFCSCTNQRAVPKQNS